MKKIYVIILSFIAVLSLSACDKNNGSDPVVRENKWNINDEFSINQYVGETLIDLSLIRVEDFDGKDITSHIEIEGDYDLLSVGTYDLTLSVFDDIGTYGSINVNLNILELTCEMDSDQDKCFINVESISFTSDTLDLETVYINDFINLNWEILPLKAGNTKTINSSSNEEIATVSPSGFVFGISEGTAIITIRTVDGGYVLSKTITVIEKDCIQDPTQEKCIADYLSDDSRVIILPNENVSGTQYNEVYMNNDVYYQIYVRTYADSDDNNIGDLQGIIDNLPYLASLGVGGIWLMPIMESRSDHGYEVDDYYSVDS